MNSATYFLKAEDGRTVGVYDSNRNLLYSMAKD